MPPPALDIRQLRLRRGNSLVLDSVSFAVSPGSLTALVGPPGSGKSAVMRVLAGIDHPQEGSVARDGEVLSRMPAYRRGFGVVQQPDRLFPYLSLAENVALPLRQRGIKRTARLQQAREMLELVQIDARPTAAVRDASRQDRQRCLLARAAVFGPNVMIIDEIFGYADDLERLSLVCAIGRIHQLLGATMVLATRSMRDALPICDRMVVLRQGAVEQEAAPDQIYLRPASALVAALYGETNRLPGVLHAREDDVAVVRLACGPMVEAGDAEGLAVGSACEVVLRPEHIAVAPVPAAEMGDGALDATLIETQFWGDSTRLRLLIGSGAELVVRRPALAGLRGLQPGRPCAVAWQNHHVMVFAASSL